MVHARWGTNAFLARNSWRGEYDTVLYFGVWMGLPLYLSFRGCVHAIEPGKVGPGERLDRLDEFACAYLGIRRLAGTTYLPLKPLGRLKRLLIYDICFLLLAAITAVAVIATIVILQEPNPFDPGIVLFLGVCWAGAAAFLLGLAAYLLTRGPTSRQARIRAVVADCLGPFSDPAEWSSDLLAPVAEDFGLTGLNPERVIEDAERRSKSGMWKEALVVARMALGFSDAETSTSVTGRAEDLTEECLRYLGDTSPAI